MKSQEGFRIAAERDRAMFEGRAILRQYVEEKKTSEAWQENIRAEKKTMDSQSVVQDGARYTQVNPISQW